MQQLQETANNLVAGLMEDEKETAAGGGGQPAPPGPAAVPGSAAAPGSPERDRPEGADHWFYTDPQGQVQGQCSVGGAGYDPWLKWRVAFTPLLSFVLRVDHYIVSFHFLLPHHLIRHCHLDILCNIDMHELYL